MREHVFGLSGLGAKRAGAGKRGRSFEISGLTFRVGSLEHESLIREAIRQKVLQNPRVLDALRQSKGILTHRLSSKTKPIFKMERLMRSVYRELCSERT